MTHYKVAVITKDAYPDNEDEIMDLLAPFNENISVEEYVLMDFNAARNRVSKRAEAERDWKIKNCDIYREKIINADEEDFSRIKNLRICGDKIKQFFQHYQIDNIHEAKQSY